MRGILAKRAALIVISMSLRPPWFAPACANPTWPEGCFLGLGCRLCFACGPLGFNWLAGNRQPDRLTSPHAALDQQFLIDRAVCVQIKAVDERVLHLLEGEMLTAALVGAIQKRTMLSTT